MNELLFFAHIFIVIGFLMLALRRGKEALFAFISIMAILANFFVLKQIGFFSFTITCSDVFAVGAILGLNFLQEYFGREEAKKAITLSFFAMVFFVIMANIHLLYTPSPYDSFHSAYATLLKPSFRLISASLLVFFIVQKLDVIFFSFLKKAFQSRLLPIRLFISLFFSQLIDTVLFSFLGLYGLVQALFDILLISFLVKMAVILLSTPLTAFSRRFIKMKE
jgi:queuosine precursor transporter